VVGALIQCAAGLACAIGLHRSGTAMHGNASYALRSFQADFVKTAERFGMDWNKMCASDNNFGPMTGGMCP
jgi:hypothetical protein